MAEYGNIRLKVENREALKNIGRKGETYDEIVERLLKLMEGE